MNVHLTRSRKYLSQGFSLAELMVSVALFSIVVTIGVGTLMVMIDANAKAQALYSVMTNLSFSTDSMTRNIRTAYNYHCSNDNNTQLPPGTGPTAFQSCPEGGRSLVFTRERDGVRMGYRLNQGVIEENDGGGWLRITPPEVFIERLQFRALDTEPDDTNQARVMILIEGRVEGYSGQGAEFSLQTQVAQQILNY